MTALRHRGPGRPAHPPATRRVVLSVRVSPQLPGLCRDKARRDGVPLGEWIESAIRSWLRATGCHPPATDQTTPER